MLEASAMTVKGVTKVKAIFANPYHALNKRAQEVEHFMKRPHLITFV
jgi:hypothetical protein